MKVLFVHNNYASNNSGEEHAAEGLASLLEENGHSIAWYRKSSDVIQNSLVKKVNAFFSGIYNYRSVKELSAVIKEFNPDVIQVQNVYPFISPAILRQIKKKGIPLVMRCPNYRLFCPTGLHLDGNGKLCEKCLTKGRELNCVGKNCENDHFKSIGYALRNFFARTVWGSTRVVDAYIVQTRFQKQKFMDNGISEDKLHIISGLLPKMKKDYGQVTGTYISFIGRVSHEKGIVEFLEAAKRLPHLPFKVVGEVQKSDWHLKENSTANVVWEGFLSGEKLNKAFLDSKIVVVPSKCYEGFPNVITRAMKFLKPVITSNLGAMSSIIENDINGILIEPSNSPKLTKAIESLYQNDEKCRLLGRQGKIKADNLYSNKKIYNDLIAIYEKVKA